MQRNFMRRIFYPVRCFETRSRYEGGRGKAGRATADEIKELKREDEPYNKRGQYDNKLREQGVMLKGDAGPGRGPRNSSDDSEVLANEFSSEETDLISNTAKDAAISVQLRDERNRRMRAGNTLDIEEAANITLKQESDFGPSAHKLYYDERLQDLYPSKLSRSDAKRILLSPESTKDERTNALGSLPAYEIEILCKEREEAKRLRQQEQAREGVLMHQQEKVRYFALNTPLPADSSFHIPYKIRSPRMRSLLVTFQRSVLAQRHQENLETRMVAKQEAVLAQKSKEEKEKAEADKNYGSLIHVKKEPLFEPFVGPRLDAWRRPDVQNKTGKETKKFVNYSDVADVSNPDHYEPWYLDPKLFNMERMNKKERWTQFVKWFENLTLFSTIAYTHGVIPVEELPFEKIEFVSNNSKMNKVEKFNKSIAPKKRDTFVGAVDRWMDRNQTRSIWEIPPEPNHADIDTDLRFTRRFSFSREVIPEYMKDRQLYPDLPFTLKEDLIDAIRDKQADSKNDSVDVLIKSLKQKLGYKSPVETFPKYDAALKSIADWKSAVYKQRLEKLALLDDWEQKSIANSGYEFSSTSEFIPAETWLKADILNRAKMLTSLMQNSNKFIKEDKRGEKKKGNSASDEEEIEENKPTQEEVNSQNQEMTEKIAKLLSNKPSSIVDEADIYAMNEANPSSYMDLPPTVNAWAPTRVIAQDLRLVDLSPYIKERKNTYSTLPKTIVAKSGINLDTQDHTWKKSFVQDARTLIQKQAMWSNVQREQLLKFYTRSVYKSW